MIKLNNKNITYVALADSSNSIKAPKEIWYADSNNSVKLVYRRKDALIEGEDYEKYHWLIGDGSAWLDIPINFYTETYSIGFRTHSDYSYMQTIWGGGYGISGAEIRCITNFDSNRNYAVYSIRNGLRLNSNPPSLNYYQALDAEHYATIRRIADNSIELVLDGNTITKNVPIDDTFDKESVLRILCEGSEIKSITTERYNFIPCKLLKPIPKWLDANGIRRQVGECGMIDLVSGKFYGNVNSVGTFTVENYYERKEWLQGRNGAYIDTMHPLTTIDDAMRVHAHYDGVTKNPLGNEQAICGVVEDYTDNSKIWAYIYIGADSNSNAYQRGLYRIGSYGQQVDSVNSLEFTSSIYIDGNNSVFTKNSGVSSVSSNGVTKKILGNVYLFSRNTMAQPSLAVERYFQGDIASFQIGNSTFTELSVDMIPCTLTMDLPASMDANNIARTKGTSGMWDLVSDKFYGNVANSGTFKAVNLAEGVDYEVHQWLKTTLKKEDGFSMELPLNSSVFYFKRIHEAAGNTTYFVSKDGNYIYHNAVFAVQIWDIDKGIDIWNGQNLRDATELTIDSTSDKLMIGNEEVPQIDYPPSRIRFRSAGGASTFYTSSITVDGIERYIPVKLLKSIPSTYDANGIARQVGECGMYDTVNDVFYGNVASSGTFSVSDDS